MTAWITAAEVAQMLRPGMRVFVGGTTSEPGTILAALAENGNCCAGVRFVSVTIPGINETDFSTFHPEAGSTVFFATRGSRDSIAAGRAAFERLSYFQIYRCLEQAPAFDLVLVQLPPIEEGEAVSMGLGDGFLSAVVEKAGTVIGEINARQPAPRDAPCFPARRLDYALRVDRPVASLAAATETAISRSIARHAAALIEDGDCLQVGIGAIPNAILSALGGRNDLGCHSGLVSEGFMALAKAGVLTGANKNVDRNKMVAPTVLGGPDLLEWAGRSAGMRIRPVIYTHDAEVIGALDRFVSINSALEVDLAGNVNVDTIAGTLVSGPGGAIDFVRGAARSRGGKAVIAMSSTARDGQVSRIVPALADGTPVTIPGAEADYVVTEFGARRLRGLSSSARAGALVEIAHPDFRAWLRDGCKAGRT